MGSSAAASISTHFSTNGRGWFMLHRSWRVAVDRRRFLKGAATGAVAAATPTAMHAQDHDHDHAHQNVPSDPALRTKALESPLVEKGLDDPAALDALVDTYEHKIGRASCRERV